MLQVGDPIESPHVGRTLLDHETPKHRFILASLSNGGMAIFRDGHAIFVADTSVDRLEETLVQWNKLTHGG